MIENSQVLCGNEIGKSFLFLIAHQDDEVLFSGGLLSRISNKNDIDIVCMSMPKPGRKDTETRVQSAISVCEKIGARYLQTNYNDSGSDEPVGYDHTREYLQRAELIVQLLMSKKYDYVITHNSEGEYGHFYHRVIHRSTIQACSLIQQISGSPFDFRKLYFFGHATGNVIAGHSIDVIDIAYQASEKKSLVDLYLPNWEPTGRSLEYCYGPETYALFSSSAKSEGLYRLYTTYEEYVSHQSEKNGQDYQIDWHRKNFQNCVEKFQRRFSMCDQLMQLQDKESLTALCLGARAGDEVQALRNLGFQNTLGIDINPVCIVPGLVIKGDVHNLNYQSSTVDIVYSNILDHLYYSKFDDFMESIKLLLRSGGHIIFDVGVGAPLGMYEANSIVSSDMLIRHFAKDSNFEILQNSENKWLSSNVEHSLNHTFIARKK